MRAVAAAEAVLASAGAVEAHAGARAVGGASACRGWRGACVLLSAWRAERKRRGRVAATHGVSSQSRSSPAGTRRPHRGKSPVPCSHSGRPLAWLRSSKQGATLSMWSRRGASRADVECEGLVHRKVLCEMRSVMVARSWPADDQEDSVGQHVGRRRIPTRAGGRGGAPASPASSHAATASRPAPADILPRPLSEASTAEGERKGACLLPK